MEKLTLEQKCLKVAINQIKQATTRERANIIYLAWGVFHHNKEFMEAIETKKKYFENKPEINGIRS